MKSGASRIADRGLLRRLVNSAFRPPIAIALVLVVLVRCAHAQDDDASPHRMLNAKGETDTDKCAVCHETDMTLSRSKVETCTLCHALTLHSGAAEHLAASAASVARLIPAPKEGAPVLPLTDDGRMYCGTCHLFHDARVLGEPPLPSAWVPPSTGVPEAVRAAVRNQWEESAHRHEASSPEARFATKSTRALRLPVEDGGLCRHCHHGLVE